MIKIALKALLIALMLSVLGEQSYAAKKSDKGPKGSVKLPAEKLFIADTGKVKFTCGQVKGWEPGTMTGKGKAFFLPIRAQLSILKKSPRSASNDKKMKKLKSKQKAGKAACAGGPPLPPEGTPAPTPLPEPQFIEYTEPLTAADVRYMFQKLAYAATDSDIANCTGKTAAWCFDNRINVFDPAEHQQLIVNASRYLDGNPDQGDFYSNGNGNGQINLAGLQMASAYIMQNTSAQYYARLVYHQLHHHYAFVYGTLGTDMVRQRGAWTFFQKLYTQAQDGSFQRLFRAMTFDPVLQIFLDNASNTKYAPGENFPREVWELYGIGKSDPDGNPNYDNLTDIPQFSKAFTGWVAQNFFDPTTNRNELTITFVSANHAEGDKLIFQGTPYQRTISSLSDAVDASISYPTFGYHQAQLLAKMYLANDPSKEELLELAQEVVATDNIHAVIKKMATSTLFFGKYRAAVMKDGLTMLMVPARTLKRFGFTVTPQTLQAGMVNVSHEIANSPQGPFGWIPYNRWSGQRMATINSINSILVAQQPQVNGQNYNYCSIISGLPSSARADKASVISHLAEMFGVTLTNQQMQVLMQYMDFTPTGFDSQGNPSGYTVSNWNPDDPQVGATQCRRKLIGLIKIILASVPFSAN